MLKDALDFIFKAADAAANPKPIVRKLGPRRRMVQIGDQRFEETLEAPILRRDVESIRSFLATVNQFKGEKPTVYVCDHGATAILDDSDRLETVNLRFEASVASQAFARVEKGVTQKELVRTLRTTLAGCIQHDTFQQLMRQVQFDTMRGRTGSITHTKESLGASVEKQVRASAGEIPDVVRVRMPAFSTPSSLEFKSIVEFECATVFDCDDDRISLVPVGDQLVRESQRLVSEVAELMVSEGVLVLEGEFQVDALAS